MFNKRILKTGAIAVAATIVFAVFAFRVAEWSKGFNSEIVVLGQSGGSGGGSSGGCTPSATGTTSTCVSGTKIIPQIAVGSFDGGLTKYRTVIQIVNPNSTAVTVSGNFYKTDGTASALTFGTNLTAAPTVTGTLASTSLAANTVLVITGETATTGTVGWAKIVATNGTVSISTFFEIRDGNTNTLYSRVGVQASPNDLASFVIPRTRNVSAGLDVAFALVNTASTAATINATLRDANGSPLGTRSLTLGAGQQTAQFTREFFSLSNEPAGTNYHFLTFTSTSPSFAAIALAFEGGTQTSFPVDRLQ